MSGGGSKLARLCCDYVRKVEDIPDLLVKILSYLPVDSVLRCKLVCKSWYRLIKEPQFAQLRFTCSPKVPKFILYQSLADTEPEARNNLSLMDIDGKTSPYVTLPPSLDSDCSLRNAFELEETSYKYEIYTPDDGYWGRISEVEQCPVTNLACPYFPTHLCVGGRMYWLVWSKEDSEVPDYILCVDVDGNLAKLKLPETDRTEFNIFTFLVDYEGCLALVAVCDDESCLFLWSLENHDTLLWSLHGGAELSTHTNSFIDSINSIVSVGQELLFIINIALAPFFCFKFLNADEMTWREIGCHFRPEECEPVVFQYEESLFRCGRQESTTLGEGEGEDED